MPIIMMRIGFILFALGLICMSLSVILFQSSEKVRLSRKGLIGNTIMACLGGVLLTLGLCIFFVIPIGR